eukprot:TRINITY_DN92079_c0_g1_i1.p1 TRINITY_DN92079_c0_g1~~TRINITY_DN92079_c0_g1_i1.p1  ORF type:complete len:178 (-),score=33.83 TRINITY_DN92079_c0_g1_i1:177-668(-)
MVTSAAVCEMAATRKETGSTGADQAVKTRVAFDALQRHLQMGMRWKNCERAELVLDRAETDARIGELEQSLNAQQVSNELLFRRVQMLEQVLQIERAKRLALQEDLGAAARRPSVARLPTDILSTRAATEDLLRLRNVVMSARAVLRVEAHTELERSDRDSRS